MNELRWQWRWRRLQIRRLAFERVPRWTAFRMPTCLVYWCAIRVIAHATTGEYSSQVVPELTAIEALRRYPYDSLGAGKREAVSG